MGRVLIAPIAPDEFLVVGIDAQVSFHRTVHPQTVQTQFLRVQEGHYEGSDWKPGASGTATRRTVDCFSAPPAQYCTSGSEPTEPEAGCQVRVPHSLP